MKEKLYSIREAVNLIKDIKLRNLILLNEEHKQKDYGWDIVEHSLSNYTVINYSIGWRRAINGLPDGVNSYEYWSEIYHAKDMEFYSSIEERDRVEGGISIMDDTIIIATKRIKGNEITV